MDRSHNYNYCSRCVDPSPRQTLMHQNNTVIIYYESLVGYKVNANAKQTALKKYMN